MRKLISLLSEGEAPSVGRLIANAFSGMVDKDEHYFFGYLQSYLSKDAIS
jgi:hypothetical protein